MNLILKMSEKIISVVLTHQSPDRVKRMCDYWERLFPECALLIAYGGSFDHFEKIKGVQKVYIDDLRLRTKDHQRENQSYAGVFRAVSGYLKGSEYEYVYFTEFDQIPLCRDLLQGLIRELKRLDADVLFHGLEQVDGTGSAHYLYHQAKDNFLASLRKFSRRPDYRVVLSSLGFGQFWKRSGFDDVAALKDDVEVYLELWIPTVAHHLGYRVKNVSFSKEHSTMTGDRVAEIKKCLEQKVECLHPVKTLWEKNSAEYDGLWRQLFEAGD